jgi:hypothetical protein
MVMTGVGVTGTDMSMVGYDNYMMMIIMRIGLALLAWHVDRVCHNFTYEQVTSVTGTIRYDNDGLCHLSCSGIG